MEITITVDDKAIPADWELDGTWRKGEKDKPVLVSPDFICHTTDSYFLGLRRKPVLVGYNIRFTGPVRTIQPGEGYLTTSGRFATTNGIILEAYGCRPATREEVWA